MRFDPAPLLPPDPYSPVKVWRESRDKMHQQHLNCLGSKPTTIVINVGCHCHPCKCQPKFSRTILSIERIDMHRYLVTFDLLIDPNTTSETFNIRLPDGVIAASIPVDIALQDLIFEVDDPALLVGAVCYTVDSNVGGSASESTPVPFPVPSPPAPPVFSRGILSIVPVDAMFGKNRRFVPQTAVRKIR